MKLLIDSQLQRSNRWSLGMDKWFHPTLYRACDHLSMIKLIHISTCKRNALISWQSGKICNFFKTASRSAIFCNPFLPEVFNRHVWFLETLWLMILWYLYIFSAYRMADATWIGWIRRGIEFKSYTSWVQYDIAYKFHKFQLMILQCSSYQRIKTVNHTWSNL